MTLSVPSDVQGKLSTYSCDMNKPHNLFFTFVIARAVIPSHIGGGGHRVSIYESGNLIWRNRNVVNDTLVLLTEIIDDVVSVTMGSGSYEIIAF